VALLLEDFQQFLFAIPIHFLYIEPTLNRVPIPSCAERTGDGMRESGLDEGAVSWIFQLALGG
jgi:hypothetical protein